SFVLMTGLLRLAGLPVLDLSRQPIAAVSPADFWRRYNCEAGRFFREIVFVPLGGPSNPVIMIIVTFLVSGVLHEYLATVLIGRLLGLQIAYFLVNGLAAAATFRWRPRGAARFFGLAATLLFNVATTPLFFLTANQFLPWYSH